MTPTRDAQLRGPRHKLQTILSWRDYRCDALYAVAAWYEEETPRFSLDALTAALARPVFTLYLGRKSCPPGLPIVATVVSAPTAAAALATVALPFPFAEPGWMLARMQGGSRSGVGVFWEGDPQLAGFSAEQELSRRDDPDPLLRRSFRTRRERYGSLSPMPGSEVEDGADVPQPHSPEP